MAEQVVELAPGESKQVSFEAVPHEARTYQVSVDGLSGSFTALALPSVDLVAGNFTFHSVNGIPFSEVGVDSDGTPYAVLAQPLVLSSLPGLSINFTWQGTIYVIDYGNTLFCGLWWSLDPAYLAAYNAAAAICEVAAIDPTYGFSYDAFVACMADKGYNAAGMAFAPPFYCVYISVPTIGNKWASPFTMTVAINSLSNAGYGTPPAGNWIATIKTIVPGGGPAAAFGVRGIRLQ